MCLTTDRPADIKIADKDILCYKVTRATHIGLGSNNYSFKSIYGFVYKIGRSSKRITLSPNNSYYGATTRVEEGYHSLHKLGDCEYVIEALLKDYGLFIIPKGAEYIEGWDNNSRGIAAYVSSTLIYLGKPDSLISKIILKWRSIFTKK